ncbi:developmental regulatory protein [Physcia stellaris]|nr:developmental regulatory protein [Physcia stellaris]
MRTDTMLSYNPVDFAFHSPDKGHDFATQLEEPFTDLFDHYVGQDSSSSSDNFNDIGDLGLFEFPSFEDAALSGSYIADQPASNFSQPQGGRLHRSSRIAFPISRSSEPVLQRRHHRSACFDRPTAAISGTELLSLEGKLPHQTPSTQKRPSFLGTPTLPLRRKPKFTPESLRLSSNHRVSKTGASNGNDSPTMIRPSQYQRQETPEWTNRFEQISLQTPTQSSTFSSHDQGLGLTIPQKLSHNARQVDLNQTIHLEENENTSEKVEPDSIRSSFAFPADYSFEQHARTSSQTQTPLPHGLPSAWTPLSKQEEFDFTISPKDLHQDWSQDMMKSAGSYYDNAGAIQSAPALSQHDSTFSNESHLAQCNPFGQFISEDPSEDYLVTTMNPFQMSATNSYSSAMPTGNARHRASTPSSRSSSACPSPPPSAKPPPKPRKRSKSSRRKSSAGALRSPKSAGALGFVNFTPSDSQKILTGVAPSGSSKTKARRELEAIERKRRLSMAAEKAVKDAGGDLEKLRAAALF